MCQDQVTTVELLMKTVLLRCVVTVSCDALSTFSRIYWWFKESQISAICCQGSHQKPATWSRPSCCSSIWQSQQDVHSWENEKSRIGSNITMTLGASPYVNIRPVAMRSAESYIFFISLFCQFETVIAPLQVIEVVIAACQLCSHRPPCMHMLTGVFLG